MFTKEERLLKTYPIEKSSSGLSFDSLPVIQSFPSPTNLPRGLEHDGNYLYTCQATDVPGEKDLIFKIDPNTGDTVETYEWTLSDFPMGIAWDGTNFYVSDDSFEGKIQVVDTNFNYVREIDAPEDWQRDLAFDGTYLLEATSYSDKIWTLNPLNGSVINVFDSPLDWPAGVAWDGSHIWHSNSEFLGDNDYIYKLNTAGNIIEQYRAPGTYPNGLAFDGQYLWVVDWDTDTIYKLQPPE